MSFARRVALSRLSHTRHGDAGVPGRGVDGGAPAAATQAAAAGREQNSAAHSVVPQPHPPSVAAGGLSLAWMVACARARPHVYDSRDGCRVPAHIPALLLRAERLARSAGHRATEPGAHWSTSATAHRVTTCPLHLAPLRVARLCPIRLVHLPPPRLRGCGALLTALDRGQLR
jgi:hypothetical protein